MLIVGLCGPAYAGPRELFQAQMDAVRAEYFRLSGRRSIPPETKLNTVHLQKTGSGMVYLVYASAPSSPEPVGPYHLVEVLTGSTTARSFEMPFPERMIAVFGNQNWGATGAERGALTSLQEVFSFAITDYRDKLRLYLTLANGRPLLPPLAVTGQVVPGNDGSQLPWWPWSLVEPEWVDPALPAAAPAGSHRLPPQRLPVALLYEDGTVFAGRFSPGDLQERLPPRDQFIAPTNAFQRLYFSMFHSLPEVDDAHRTTMCAAGNLATASGIHIRLVPQGKGPRTLTPSEILVGSIGLPTGPSANPHHQLLLRFVSEEGPTLTVAFQNDLPNLRGRTLAFTPNHGAVGNYQEPVQVWYAPEPSKTLMVGGMGRPVRSGTFRVLDFDVADDGLLSGIIAEVTFETADYAVDGTVESATGVLRLQLPRGTLLPPFTMLSGHDVRVHRPGAEDFYPREAGENDRWRTLIPASCGASLAATR